MGYTTKFKGNFTLNKPLEPNVKEFLIKLSKTRRMKRNVGDEFGIDGEFYVDGGGVFGQDHEQNIVEYNKSPTTQPDLWCKWIPNEQGTAITWNKGEKFYNYIPWIFYIIHKILEPNGYILNGTVKWNGEDFEDVGSITITDNIMEIKHFGSNENGIFNKDNFGYYMRLDIVKNFNKVLT